jgi:hypothetical protein
MDKMAMGGAVDLLGDSRPEASMFWFSFLVLAPGEPWLRPCDRWSMAAEFNLKVRVGFERT